ncbi:MAG: ComF family protein [Alphaproteobacteria bacterium]|nr:ComF family protein [Alphaproteobacteria bacterium]
MKITSFFTQILKQTTQTICDFVFPPQCPYCEKTITREEMLCTECFKKIPFITGPKCYRCGCPLPFAESEEKLLCPKCLTSRSVYDLSRSVFEYDSFSRNAILKLKYADRTDLRHFFVEYMCRAGIDLFDKADIVLPVPLYWTRRLKRKYNQSAILAELIAKKMSLTYSPHILHRKRATKAQAGQTKQERLKNVHSAFSIRNADKIKGKHVLLIDDVLTTGATANACAKILKENGAKAVYVLTIAQAVIK